MRKIIATFIVIWLSINLVWAKDNTLLSVKSIALPDNRIRIDFCFSGPVKQLPASFVTQQPPRLVLDFINAELGNDQSLTAHKVQLGEINHYNFLSVGNRVRAIFDLDNSVAYSGTVTGHVYSLLISGKTNFSFEHAKQVFVTNQPINAAHDITHIDFRGNDKQGGKVVIDVSDANIPIDVEQRGKEIEVNFQNTRMVRGLPTRYDVADFQSPAQIITAQQMQKSVKMMILTRGDFGHFAYQVNKQFIIDIFPLTPEEIKRAKLKKKVFSGKRISLSFQKIPVRSVLQLLADFTGVNIVVSQAVQGDITLRLNDIPWDQALDIILTTQGLAKKQTGNVILIDKEENFERQEQTQLQNQQKLESLVPLTQELIQLNYAKAVDIATLVKAKETSLLSERGKISVDARTNTIWIQDTAAQIEQVTDLIKKLDVPVKQVLIESRIVDVKKDFAQDLGIRFGVSKPTHLSGTLEGANQLAQGINPANVTPFTDRLNLDLPAVPASLLQPASIGIALAKLGNGVLLDLELLALESEDKAELVASPRLITASQQSAVIESGQEIPYQESTSSGATSIAFKKAVLSLKVTPQITPDSRILLDLQINQDADSGDRVLGVPIILTKSIQTNVLLNNGQTVVLGGIYQRDKNNSLNRVPFLGQLPVIGNLFRNRSVSVKNEELLIFITPKIITDSLSVTSIEGQPNQAYARVELDKFGKPVHPPQ